VAGPSFDLHLCGWEAICPGDNTLAQQDTVQICATNVSPDIMGPITIIDSKRIFLLDTAALCSFEPGCDTSFSQIFVIPDKINDAEYPGIDADTGQWMVCAWAQDSAGNVDTVCIQHAPDLTWKIDTRKPIIDSVTVELTTDNNGDGKITFNDCVTITGWGLSNPWEPELEVDSMIVDMSHFGKGWVQLDDVLEHNRVFRAEICLDVAIPGLDTADCEYNTFTVWAYDNACNYDTMPGCIADTIDLDIPVISNVTYEYYFDYDTTFACIGIGDEVYISATVFGPDIASVTVDMKDAGIDELIRTELPLPPRGGGLYDTVWTVTEPPIADGKDADNSVPPTNDADYRLWITACDDVGNCVSQVSPVLNRTLDTRVPRPIGYFCPDTVPCALHARSLPGGVVELYWDRDCDEMDAWYFYVWADDGSGYDSIGATFDGESLDPDFNFWNSEPLPDGMYTFKIKTEDNCSNVGDFSCEVAAFADGVPPNACIVYPDSGSIFAAPFAVKARSEDMDIFGVQLWWRLRPDLNDPPSGGPGQWQPCGMPSKGLVWGMYRPDEGLVFLDTVDCIDAADYVGWIELLPVSCDIIGNCQDTATAYPEACLDDDVGNLVPGHFLFLWDNTRPVVQVVSVNDTISPQSSCGFNVMADVANQVVIDVPTADPGDLFTVDVRVVADVEGNRIHYENDVTMPFTIDVYVENWDAGTQNLFVHVTAQANGQACIPDPLVIPLCVPPQIGPCMEIVAPHEWQLVPCSKTDMTCVDIWAGLIEGCPDTLVTQVEFRWADNPDGPWYFIDEVLESDGGYWKTCWNNKEWLDSEQLHHGDEVFFIVIGYNQFHVPDTSHMVKVYLDCEAPQVELIVEDIIYTCDEVVDGGIPKIGDDITLKAKVVGDTVDITELSFWMKPHSAPDLPANWIWMCDAEPAWYENIFMCHFDASGLTANTWYDIRIFVVDQAGNVWWDNDEDGMFDDATFMAAVAAGAGVTVYYDTKAPQPAISMVADLDADIYNINPSHWLGCFGNAYVQAGHDILGEVSVLPSEDSCEAVKVHWYLQIGEGWAHVGTSTDKYHFPVTFNPMADGLIPAYELEDGWWMGWLRADLYDALGNMEDDTVSLYILDITPSQAIIIDPLNDSYVAGDVTLNVAALNAYEIAQVCYEFKADGTQDWLPVNGDYANACVAQSCEEPERAPGVGGGVVNGSLSVVWHTLNTVEDGVYYLRAVATDCDNNVDDDPPTIKVTVANGLPTVTIDDPRMCERACPDNPEDILGYVSGTVMLYATAGADIPVTKVEFYYKNIFVYPSEWTLIGTDYFPTAGKYAVEWDSGSLADGRYHVKARAYTAAGRYADSDPVTVSVDNSAPFAQIVSVMGEPIPPDGIDITLGDVIDIELWAMDSTSTEGWTRCYNAGVVSIEVCIEDCTTGTEYTKCFEVSPAFDGFHTVQWNTSGLPLNTDNCSGCYQFYVKAFDCVGNGAQSPAATVHVYDIKAPVTTIGGFDGGYIYAYSSENISTVQFQYADSADANWIPIGLSDKITASGCYLYKTSWDPGSLENGTYKVRAISHDQCSNQDDDMAPVAYIKMLGGLLTPYNPAALGTMSFLKNWCTGDMQGIVEMTSSVGTPTVIGKFGSTFACLDMQAHQQNGTEYAGSFDAASVSAKFFSSVTTVVSPPPMTGEPTKVTYLATGTFDVAMVKTDLGTHGDYLEGDVSMTIQGGAVSADRYIWIAPTEMPWAPPHQPDYLPIGDDNHYATHISFTDCDYCCDFYTTHFGGEGSSTAGAGTSNGSDCCFNYGKYAKIKMSYHSDVNLPAEQLAVAWWDCYEGEYSFAGISYHNTEGFDTENHTVEFNADCLKGPFVVIQLLERHCEGSIVVNMMQIEPYCNGYTSPTPTFDAVITDNVQGTDAIDQGSIQWRIDLFNPGELVRFYDGEPSSFCDRWMPGFGNFSRAGYDEVSGIFRAGFNDPHFGNQYDCEGCDYQWWSDDYWYFCSPLYPLDAGDHMATVTAMNDNIQTCTDTAHFVVDATEPKMWFEDYQGAYVGRNPQLCMYFTDTEAGVDKNSIWIDIYGDETTSPDPNNHHAIGTIRPDQLNWVDDTTACLDFTFDYDKGGYLHIYVYGGPDCYCGGTCEFPQFYEYMCGISDCVGNQMDVFWRYYTVDAYGPDVDADCGSSSGGSVKFTITDTQSGVDWSTLEFYEDGLLLCEGLGCIDEESISLDPDRGILRYTPDAYGMDVEIRIKDNAGNLTVHSCVTEGQDLVFDPHNYPNPFDPREGPTTIDLGLSKSDVNVTIKIYDFGGEFVKELPDVGTWSWDGATDDGTEVANGTYLGYIHVRDYAGATKTAVIKITVLKQDE
jgi:hypothetical protein